MVPNSVVASRKWKIFVNTDKNVTAIKLIYSQYRNLFLIKLNELLQNNRVNNMNARSWFCTFTKIYKTFTWYNSHNKSPAEQWRSENRLRMNIRHCDVKWICVHQTATNARKRRRLEKKVKLLCQRTVIMKVSTSSHMIWCLFLTINPSHSFF